MGLDMYLYAVRKGDENKPLKRYDDADGGFNLHYPDGRVEKLESKFEKRVVKGRLGLHHVYYADGKRIAASGFLNSKKNEAGYWRKFHVLHHWFVENYEGGREDDCEPHEVSLDTLERLLAILKDVYALCPNGKLPDYSNPDELAKFNDACAALPLYSLRADSRDFLAGEKLDDDFFFDVHCAYKTIKSVVKKMRDGKVSKVLYQASW